MRGLDAAGVYVPPARLPTEELATAWERSHAPGIETKAVPAADEDALTMAVAAGERTLTSADVDRAAVDLVVSATTAPPLEEGEYGSRLVRALGLGRDTATATLMGSTASGGEAIDRGLAAGGPALVTASDCPSGEPAEADHPFGAGAAAMLVTDDAAVSLTDSAWHVADYPGIRSRPRGTTDTESLDITTYERTAIRESVVAAVDGLALDPAETAGVALHQPTGRMPGRIARGLEVPEEALRAGTVVDRIGDAGAATVPIGFLAAIASASPGETSIAGAFGGGTTVAVAAEGTTSVPGLDGLANGSELSYPAYLRSRGHVVDGEVAGGGAHVSMPNWQASLDQRYRLIAGRCPECDGVTFPPDGACQHCHERVDFEPVEPARTGTLRAVTTIEAGAAPPEFARQQQRDGAFGVGIVDLDTDEGTVTLPGQLTDTDLSVGDRVRATFRRIYEQERVPRYGTKFAPVGRDG